MREKHGDAVGVALGPLKVTLFSHPDVVEDILVTRNKVWLKDRFLRTTLRPVLGHGLLSSEGDFWRKQRRLAQPAFHRDRIAAYAGIMVDHASRLGSAWRDGEVRDVHKDMMRLTLAIVAETLFGAQVGDHAEAVGEALEAVLAVVADPLPMFLPMLRNLPTPRKRRFDRAVKSLDAIIYGVIEARQKVDATHNDDLLSMLLMARDDDGSRMSNEQLRDECLTLFLAGHETTAINLSWTWLLLSQYPDVKAKLARELDHVLGDRPPTFADVPSLRYTTHVITESLRLYPPAWSMGREAGEDVDVGGYRIARGRFNAIPAGSRPPISSGRNAGKATSRSACPGSPTSRSVVAPGFASGKPSRNSRRCYFWRLSPRDSTSMSSPRHRRPPRHRLRCARGTASVCASHVARPRFRLTESELLRLAVSRTAMKTLPLITHLRDDGAHGGDDDPDAQHGQDHAEERAPDRVPAFPGGELGATHA
jgi:cytochrome P450